jgi:hypothetical protein
MRATWKGPGSFSTSSGALRAGEQFDADAVPAAYLAELVAAGLVVLHDRPAPPKPAEVKVAPIAREVIVPPPPVAPPVLDAPPPQAAAVTPPAAEAKPKKKGKR